MRPVFLGRALVTAGAVTGIRALRRAGTVLSLGSAAAMADIGMRDVVPGANDNLSGVATVLGVAATLAERPVAGRSTTPTSVAFTGGAHILLRRGHRAGLLGSYGHVRRPVAYHTPDDTLDRLDYDAVADAVWLIDTTVRLSAQR